MSFLAQENTLRRTAQFIAEHLTNGDVSRIANIHAELRQPTTDIMGDHLVPEDMDTALRLSERPELLFTYKRYDLLKLIKTLYSLKNVISEYFICN